MIFTKRSRKGSTNYASSSSIATNKRKNSHQNPVEDQKSVQLRNASMVGMKIRSVGPICKSRGTIPSASWKMPIGEDEEESDFHGQLASEEWPSNHSDEGDDSCRWLSSGNSSPSCCFDDKIFANLLELSLDDWLASLLIFCNNYSSSPLFGRATSFFDGSRVTPLEGASSILASSSEEDILEEEITTWLMNSLEADKLSAQSYQESNVWDHFIYSSKDDLEVPEMWEFDEGLLESFLDLEDGEDSEWISDNELSFLQIDFPSPSYRSSWSCETFQSSDFVSSCARFAPAESTNTENDEPIFWPFAHKFASNVDSSRDLLIVSPRKITSKFLLQNSEMDVRERRKLSLNSTLGSTKKLEKQRGKGDNDVQLIHNAPNPSTKLVRSFLRDDTMEFKNEECFTAEEIVDPDEHCKSMEEDFEVVQEHSIGKLLGLDEFEGHEGIELGFNKDSPFVDESFKEISL